MLKFVAIPFTAKLIIIKSVVDTIGSLRKTINPITNPANKLRYLNSSGK
jgi:hypothetical protein